MPVQASPFKLALIWGGVIALSLFIASKLAIALGHASMARALVRREPPDARFGPWVIP
jgi:hypothetical protein